METETMQGKSCARLKSTILTETMQGMSCARLINISISHKGEVPDIGLCHLPGPRAGSPYAGDPSALTPKGNQPN